MPQTPINTLQNPRNDLYHTVYKRILQNFPHKPSGEAFVVSLYGEWGVGKTYALKQLQSYFDTHQKTAEQEQDYLYIPVFYSPWKYEKEEHLIISLLKTIEQAIIQAQNEPKDASSDFKDTLQKTGTFIADLAIALTAGLSFKFGLLGAELNVNIKDMLEYTNKLKQDSSSKDDAKANKLHLESLYYSFHTYCQELSGGVIRFVILIDDLDRCLPEKAVQMLESIKLFLNQDNFSYVLAIDEEVIERGINHRYRDYIFQSQSQDNNTTSHSNIHPPITGTEYLEKIIHLPVHLSLWSQKQVIDFLKQESMRDFFMIKQQDKTPSPEDHKQSEPTQEESIQYDDKLIGLFVNALPPVPRKIIRAYEGAKLKYEYLSQINHSPVDKISVARITILQQMYPELFRLIRREYKVFRWIFLTTIKQNEFDFEQFSQEIKNTPQERFFAKYKQILKDSINNRYSIYPTDIVLEENEAFQLSLGAEEFGLLYILEDPQSQQELQEKEKQLTDIHAELSTPSLPPTNLAISLLSGNREAREIMIKDEKLHNHALPEEYFQSLLKEAKNQKYISVITSIAWLEQISQIVSKSQYLTLYQELKIIDLLAKEDYE